MKYFLLDIIPKIQKYSRQLDEVALLTNQQWVSVDEIENTKTSFIFRQNNQLLIAQNARVEKATWEYIGANTILLDRKEESYLFKHGFLDETILALKLDGSDTYAVFINETKYGQEINSLKDINRFLESKYLNKDFSGTPNRNVNQSTELNKFGNKRYKLPHLDEGAKEALRSESSTLAYMIQNYERYIRMFKNTFLPVYIAFELERRGEVLDKNSRDALNKYSKSAGYFDFSSQIEPYEI